MTIVTSEEVCMILYGIEYARARTLEGWASKISEILTWPSCVSGSLGWMRVDFGYKSAGRDIMAELGIGI